MLTRLPVLFDRRYVLAAEELDYALPVAQRQLRLVKGVFAGALGLCALTFTPQFSGPGPLLTWAAKTWPDLFGAVVALMSQPISTLELAGSAVLVVVLSAVCVAEIRGLAGFIEDLEPVEPTSSVRDAVARLEATTPGAAVYVRAVTAVRTLRLGDWRMAREISESPER